MFPKTNPTLRYYNVWLLLACSFLLGCGTPNPVMLLTPGEYPADQISESLKEGADIVTRTYERDIELLSKSEAYTTVRFAVTVLNKDGQSHGRLVLPYDQFRSVEYVHGTLRDSNGQLIRVLESDEERDFKATSSISLYDDNRVKLYELYHSTYPYTVEYEYRIKHNGLTSFSNMRIQGFREGVEYAEFRISYPANMQIAYNPQNADPEVKEETVNEKKVRRFTYQNMAPLKQEPYGPPSSTYLPQLSVSPHNFAIENTAGSLESWQEFGKWYYQLSQGKQNLPESIKNEVDQLLQGVETDSGKLNILYNYLQDKTRYVSVQLGIGGWEPFSASYVAKNEYGDCKALTNFMMALAKYAGITTYPVLINSGSDARYQITPEFPANAFNHVVLMAPMEEDTLWMECTSKTMVFGDIGLPNEGRYALAVTPDGGKLIKTPSKAYHENEQINRAQLQITEQGSVSASISTIYTGNQQQYIRQSMMMKNDRERMKWLRSSLGLNSVQLEDVQFMDPAEPASHYTLEYQARAPDFATKTGTRLFVPANALNRWGLRLPEKGDRKRDIYLPFTYQDTDSTVIELPEGYEVESIPEIPGIESDYIRYTAEISVRDVQTLVYKREIALKKERIPNDKYSAIREMFDQIYEEDRRRLVLSERD